MAEKTGFNFGPRMAPFMSEIQKVLVQQPDFRGIGGHGVENHGGHGPHSQTSIGVGSRTVEFRQIGK